VGKPDKKTAKGKRGIAEKMGREKIIGFEVIEKKSLSEFYLSTLNYIMLYFKNSIFLTHPFASAMLFPSLREERGNVRLRMWGE
jgi:hypothetical protein